MNQLPVTPPLVRIWAGTAWMSSTSEWEKVPLVSRALRDVYSIPPWTPAHTDELHRFLTLYSTQTFRPGGSVPFTTAAHEIWVSVMCSECLSSRPAAQFRKPSWWSVSHLLAPSSRDSISPVLSIFPSLSTESSQPASGAAVAKRVLKLGGLSSDHPEQLSRSFQTMASSRDRPQGLAQRCLLPPHS